MAAPEHTWMPGGLSALQQELACLRSSREENHRLLAEIRHNREEMHCALSNLNALVQTMASPGEFRRVQDNITMLTPREREVLRLIGEGRRTKQIAFALGISFKTAVTHRAHIMEKLGVHEGPGLVRFAIRNGLCRA